MVCVFVSFHEREREGEAGREGERGGGREYTFYLRLALWSKLTLFQTLDIAAGEGDPDLVDLYLLLRTVFLVHRLGTERSIDKFLSSLVPFQLLTMMAGRLILRERENSGEPNLMRENTRGERADSLCACSFVLNKLAGNVAPAPTAYRDHGWLPSGYHFQQFEGATRR